MMALLLLSMTIMFVSGPSPVLAGGDERFLSCSNKFDCGDIRNIAYPFRRIDRPEYCGYPGFQLNCSGKTPVITINQLTYNVINIDGASRTLTVARADYSGGICPSKLVNTSLDFNLFAYSAEDQNITLYYNCLNDPSPPPPISSQSPPDSESSSSFTCTINQVETLGFYLTTDPSSLGFANEYLELCKHKVFVPVYKTAIPSTGITLRDVAKAFERGFELGWSDNVDAKCHACLNSGGKCGYNITASVFACYCSDQAYGDVCGTGTSLTNQLGEQKNIKLPAAAVSAIATVGVIVLLSIVIYITKRGRLIYSCKALLPEQYSVDNRKIEAFMLNFRTLPNRYSYSDVKKMTNSFQSKLGQGGFGTVYKGGLADGRFVAVKVLKKMKANGEEFTNEVASISRTSHVNVVALLGFCYEGNRRALIYEYMPNGSLDRFICGELSLRTNGRLEWRTLHEVAIGIARGLEYLHRGCNTTMVHFDIKPHNVLLDEDFCPKISDFGLAKLCERKESKVSMSEARGTVGYIAPEVFHRHFGGVSHKSDVYSYGMILLEMVGDRKRTDIRPTDQSRESYFPDQYYYKLESGDLASEHHPADITEEEEGIIRKLMLVGLWCIRTNPSERPSMTEVIQMLEGSLESLQIPPKPSFSYARKSSYSQFSSKSFPAFSGSQPEEEDQEIASGPQS